MAFLTTALTTSIGERRCFIVRMPCRSRYRPSLRSLGYAGAILHERLKPSARVVVFEPDEELFKFSLSRVDNHWVLQE
jgi:hypothetical protein